MAVDDSILAKIHKLLALATSDNENEAAIAAAKAQTLLIEYNVSEEELNSFNSVKNEKVIQVTSDGKTTHNRTGWYGTLAHIVAKSNLCELLLGHGGSLIWIGKQTNVDVAQYIFENLVRDLTRICEITWATVNYEQSDKPKWQRVHGKTWKNSFYHGANQSIRSRLNANLKQLKEAQNSVNALVVRNDIELEDYMKAHYSRLSYSYFGLNKNRSGFEAGKAAGQAIPFRSGIGAGGSIGPKLLDKGR